MGVHERPRQAGDLIFLSGRAPRQPNGSMPTGIVGEDFSIEEAYDFVRTTGLSSLAAMNEAYGSLAKVEVIKVSWDGQTRRARVCLLLESGLNGSTQRFILGQKMECADGSEISSRICCGREDRVIDIDEP